VVYVVSGLMVVQTNGMGRLTPNCNGQWLAIGKRYSMQAQGVNGFTFTNWTSDQGVVTNGQTVSFVMQSNLVLRANFNDLTRPTLAITSPWHSAREQRHLDHPGHGGDNAGVSVVRVKLNTNEWVTAAARPTGRSSSCFCPVPTGCGPLPPIPPATLGHQQHNGDLRGERFARGPDQRMGCSRRTATANGLPSESNTACTPRA